MRMKKTNRLYRCLLPLVWLTFLLSSCIKEDYAGSTDETATVNLVFSTRADGQGTADVDENEGIKTLRVLITDDKGKVEINTVQNFNDVPETTLTILGVPVGTKNFYVIANEASVGLTDLDDVSTVDEDFLNRVITNPSDAPYFPKTRSQISTSGLPITGMKEGVQVKGEENQQIEIEIVHAVAKVVLNMENRMEETFRVNGVALGKFFADATNLFPERGSYPIGDAGLHTHYFKATTQGFEVPPGKHDAVFVFYLYETGETALTEDFTIGLSSPTVPEIAAVKPFFTDGRNYLERNEQLVINAVVDVYKEVTVTSLNYEVQPWSSVSVEVPPFN